MSKQHPSGETEAALASGGESRGADYPDAPPKGGRKEGSQGGFTGHGGQSDMGYHGHGQLGDQKTGDNPNAPAKQDE